MVRKNEKDKKADLDFEISFFERLLEKNPDFSRALMVLGNAYTERGDFKKGLEVDQRLSRMLNDDPIVYYNLACSYSLLGLIDEACVALKKALGLGYDDFEYIKKDPDLENLRKDEKFSFFLKEPGR